MRPFVRHKHRSEGNILKRIQETGCDDTDLESSGLGWRQAAGSCEKSNEPLGFHNM